MLKKNLDRYKKEFLHISTDIQERITEFLSNKKINSKFNSKLYQSITDIMNIEENELLIVLYIIPEPTPRPRLNLRSGTFYVKNSSSNNQFIKLLVKEEKELLHLITTPCTFDLTTYQPIPKAMNVIDSILAELGLIKPVVTPDWDNYGKTYSDMIQKYILLNDSLITDGSVHKRYSLKPRVEIRLKYKINYDCLYNKRLIEHSKSYKESGL